MRHAMLRLALLGLLAGLLPAGTATGAVLACNPNTWFIAVIADTVDDPPRSDFVEDLDNAELFRSRLQSTYCFADDHVQVLAFRDGFQRHGVVYEAASEAGLKGHIAAFGAAARLAPKPQLFLMISSHGNVYAQYKCAFGGNRTPGSYAGLDPGGGDDGALHDCELGAALNTAFPASTKMVVAVDCSFCGGFSESLTAASGTVPDNRNPGNGIVGPNRVVITGCAITTECFGGHKGSVMYGHMRDLYQRGVAACDGFTGPGFPTLQGVDVAVRTGARDGVCTISELFYATVNETYEGPEVIGIQQQFRMKYGLSLASDIPLF